MSAQFDAISIFPSSSRSWLPQSFCKFGVSVICFFFVDFLLLFFLWFAIECRLLESQSVLLLWSVDMKRDISSAISGIGFAVFSFQRPSLAIWRMVWFYIFFFVFRVCGIKL